MERAPAGHLEAWYSHVTMGRSLLPLGPDGERVGLPQTRESVTWWSF